MLIARIRPCVHFNHSCLGFSYEDDVGLCGLRFPRKDPDQRGSSTPNGGYLAESLVGHVGRDAWNYVPSSQQAESLNVWQRIAIGE